MPGRLQDKVAVITGGCSGMGRATVDLFIAEGAKVIVADIMDEVSAELMEQYPEALRYAHCDVTKEDDVAGATELAVKTFGGLDIMFNNAGAPGSSDPLEKMRAEDWDRTMHLLLRSAMFGIKHSIAPMRERGGGSIITTSSLAAVTTIGTPDYAAAKAGAMHLSHLAALELAQYNIRVNTILPGIILTPLFGKSFLGMNFEQSVKLVETLGQQTSSFQPLQRAGGPRDIAEACLFYASDASAFITGTELRVDGGVSLVQQANLNPNTPGSLGELVVNTGRKIMEGS